MLNELLSSVSKPVRYLGREVNSIRKDPAGTRLRFCLAFPDVYEVGMSHLGIQILYHILNSRTEVSCERVFAPWIDMETLLRKKGIPLFSLETSRPMTDFDILGFSLQYELSFSNVLNMLSLSHIPLLAKERDDRFPLIIAGGPTAFNPAPVADFFDAMVIGDGEEVILELCDLFLQWKESKKEKDDLLKALSRVEGVYVPGFHTEGQIVRKRLVSDLNPLPFPTCPIVPFMKVVHDRFSMEIARGCKRGCRFCEAGFIHRPYRERSPEVIEEILHASLKHTGYEEISLLSLSAGDYSLIGPLLSHLMDQFESKKLAVSFPSLRIEEVVGRLASEVMRVRKTGFTIAPEAASERLRGVINKEIDEDILFQGVSDLFSKGWKTIKLYFMMGLPTEKEEDLKGILDLSRKIASLGARQKVYPNVSVSVSTFVPKPHTPFQWESQISLEEMREKLRFLKDGLKRSPCRLKWQDPHLSCLEGVFSAGDRKLSQVLIEAHRLGCRFDGWSDQFQYPLWKEAFDRAGLEMDSYTRRKTLQETFPWSFISTGVKSRFLWEEYQRGLEGEFSPPCGETCSRCGICDGDRIRVRIGQPLEIRQLKKTGKAPPQRKGTKRKIRLRFEKRGDIRFLSHLELAHLFHRAAKRADLALCYSEGFHPMPRIIFATALPVGMESMNEVVELEIGDRMNPSEIKDRLNQSLPEGIRITEATEVPLFFSISSVFHRSVYWIMLDHLISRVEANAKIREALEKETFLVVQERKEKIRSIDIRPLIEKICIKTSVNGEGASGPILTGEEREEKEINAWGVELILRKGDGATAKPLEVVGAILGLDKESLTRLKVVKLE